MTEQSQATPRLLQVFLSHASEDKTVVRELCEQLKACNIDPWLDEEKILPGQLWEEEIRKAVRNADVVLVCLSHKSINKIGYVHKEVKLALDEADKQPEGSIYIIPLKLEACELPERLKQWQSFDYFSANGFDKLLKALEHRRVSLLPISKIETIHHQSTVQSSQTQLQSSITSIVQSQRHSGTSDSKNSPKSKKTLTILSGIIVGIFLLSGIPLTTYYLSTRNQANIPSAKKTTVNPSAHGTQASTPFLGIDTFTDDFNSGSVPDGTKWEIKTSPGATVLLRDGQQVSTPNSKAISHAFTDSTRLYDIRGKSAFIEVIQVCDGTSVDTAFGLQDLSGNDGIQIYYEQGYLEVSMYNQEKNQTFYRSPYKSNAQKWWRIRESGGTTYAEASPDGRVWLELYKHPNFFDMSHVRVFTNVEKWATESTAGAAKFDNFNHV